jgi:putative tryptophan/tyrosine transport system substrate-binding protein
MERCVSRVSRRAFVVGAGGLGLLAGCGRLPGQAQAPMRVPRIGYLSAARASPGIEQGLNDLGYVHGQSLILESRLAGGQLDVLPDLAAELVHLPVDVIMTTGGIATVAAKQATSTIPIVQAAGGADLVREGIVASYARPGGNVTGLTEIVPELSAKRLELLQQAVAGLARVAVLWNPAAPLAVSSFGETQDAARLLGIQLESLEARGPDDLQRLVEGVTGGRADALLVLSDPLTITHQANIAALASAGRLPSMFDRREYVAAGGLLSYGPDVVEMPRRAAVYVDKILKGASPAELPIERPMRFDFIINLKTAQALGLTFPNEILLQVTEVIQ